MMQLAKRRGISKPMQQKFEAVRQNHRYQLGMPELGGGHPKSHSGCLNNPYHRERLMK